MTTISEEELGRRFREIAGRRVPDDAPRWLARLAVEYHDVIEERRKAGRLITSTMWERYKMAKELDEDGIRRQSEFLTPRFDERILTKTGGAMKNSKTKSKRSAPTAASILIRLLGHEKVAGDESIIKEVREATGSSKFDQKQLAWYKWKYRQGRLKGMDGKPHVIAQGSPKKAVRKKK